MKVPFLCSALIAATALFPLRAMADSPDHFLRQAIQGDNSEIMLGRMAQRQADSGKVRDFGRTLENDHMSARTDVANVARRMRLGFIANDRDIAPDARDERDRLSRLNGRDFDREFIRFMIDDHRNDIRAFREEANESNDPASMLARQQLPTLEKHLNIALSLQRGGRDADVGYRYWNRGDMRFRNDRSNNGGNYDRNDYNRNNYNGGANR